MGVFCYRSIGTCCLGNCEIAKSNQGEREKDYRSDQFSCLRIVFHWCNLLFYNVKYVHTFLETLPGDAKALQWRPNQHWGIISQYFKKWEYKSRILRNPPLFCENTLKYVCFWKAAYSRLSSSREGSLSLIHALFLKNTQLVCLLNSPIIGMFFALSLFE